MAPKRKNKKRLRQRIILYASLSVIASSMLGLSDFIGIESEAYINREIYKVEVKEISNTTANVALVRSNKENAADITDEEVRAMVREAVSLAGGLNDIIKDGDFVVIKPNLIGAKHFAGGRFDMFSEGGDYIEDKILDKKVNGIATDYRITRATAELVREINPSGKIYIMESSGWGSTRKNMEILGYTMENFPMVDKIISMDSIGGDYESVNANDIVAIDLEDKKLYKDGGKQKKITNGLFFMSKVYYEADVVIDLPVLKSHVNAGFTGAIKNVAIGVAPVRVYGREGTLDRFHVSHYWNGLNNWVHDFYLLRPVDFVITDGLQGSENGPMAFGAESYEGAIKNMRLILAGKDALAVDAIHAYTIGVDPQKVDYMELLAAEKIGIIDPAQINVIGNARVDEVKKPFGFPGFPYSTIFPKPKKSVYKDFDAPGITIQNASINKNTFKANITSNEELTKIEVLINGKLAKTIRNCDETVKLNINNDELNNNSKVQVLAYDKYLNCTESTISLN